MSNVTEANFSKLTPPSAHPALQAASDYGRACFRMAAAKLGTAEYDAALAECNETWERIAAASGVPAGTRKCDRCDGTGSVITDDEEWPCPQCAGALPRDDQSKGGA